jgi:hypothetical protein
MPSNFSPLESSQHVDFIEDYQAQGADEEVSLMHFFLDAAGVEQTSLTRTTLPSSVIQARADEFRAALETYYTSLGFILLSVQVLRERVESLYGGI